MYGSLWFVASRFHPDRPGPHQSLNHGGKCRGHLPPRRQTRRFASWKSTKSFATKVCGCFYKAVQTVELDIVSTISNVTRRPASKIDVNRACPAGGSEPASIVRVASPSPSKRRVCAQPSRCRHQNIGDLRIPKTPTVPVGIRQQENVHPLARFAHRLQA